MNKEIIKLLKISKKFASANKDIIVLKNVNIKINTGELVSLSGPSGSGKSTLLNLISLIDRPTKGFIKFNDSQVNFNENNKNDIFRAKKIGIVYQQNNLLPDFTALENLYLASLSINDNKKIAILKAEKLLKKIGLSNRSDHFPSQLSGGESQRIAIARAIINDPDIILADEPTGSLDMKTAENIFALLNNQKKPNRLIIFATHNRFFAKKADYLLELTDGSIKSTDA